MEIIDVSARQREEQADGNVGGVKPKHPLPEGWDNEF